MSRSEHSVVVHLDFYGIYISVYLDDLDYDVLQEKYGINFDSYCYGQAIDYLKQEGFSVPEDKDMGYEVVSYLK